MALLHFSTVATHLDKKNLNIDRFIFNLILGRLVFFWYFAQQCTKFFGVLTVFVNMLHMQNAH